MHKDIKPRIILHGGAGNITRSNLDAHAQRQHKHSLLRILRATNTLLQTDKTITALDAACHAVSLLELDPLYNAGVGAVFTRAGTIELEASVMVSNPRSSVKRGACVSGIKHVKSPIKLARELLVRGDESGGGGAQGHVHLNGREVETLAEKWGLDMCEVGHFWTRKRWEEHRRGLRKMDMQDEKVGKSFEEDHYITSHRPDGKPWPSNDPTWDGKRYLPQGTVGCVVLDRSGNIAVATSTGGITNKLPGRIGDTPSFGCGFWAEEWMAEVENQHRQSRQLQNPLSPFESMFQNVQRAAKELDPFGFLDFCLPSSKRSNEVSTGIEERGLLLKRSDHNDDPDDDPPLEKRALAISGTGNGDTFLRLCAAHASSSLVRFSSSPAPFPPMQAAAPPTQPTLASALNWMAGPGGQLQRSAHDRWGKTGEGEGGMIGVELVHGIGKVAYNFNCGGLFRAFVDHEGNHHWGVWEDHEVSKDDNGRDGICDHVWDLLNQSHLQLECGCREFISELCRIYNIPEDQSDQTVVIACDEEERLLRPNEQPLVILNQLHEDGRKPTLMLRRTSGGI